MKILSKVSIILVCIIVLGAIPFTGHAQFDLGHHAPVSFDNMAEVSPDNQHVAYVTADDLGMNGSTIWVSKPDGSERVAVARGGTDFWVTNPIWSPDSRQILYLKAVEGDIGEFSVSSTFELWLVNADGSGNSLLTDSSLLHPSLGYGGKTDIRWQEGDIVEFTDNAAFPMAQYALHVTTGEIVKIGESLGALEGYELGRQPSGVPLFKQYDGRWKNHRLGTCNRTIGNAGCAMSSVAMVLKYYGANVDPGSLNAWLKSHSGYASGCLIKWATAANYHSRTRYQSYIKWPDWNRLRAELNAGHPVIVSVKNNGHWVVVTHYSGNTFYINDPGYSGRTTLASYGNRFHKMVIYHGTAPSTNHSSRPAPKITGVSPNPMKPLPVSQRQSISISGSNFTSGAKLLFKITDAPGYSYPNRVPSSLSANKIVYNISVGPNTHNWTVQVINPDGKASNVYAFKVKPDSQSTSIQSGDGALPVYRMWKSSYNDHLYTTNLQEGKNLGYTYENIIGYVYPKQVSGTVPVYRQWHSRKRDHFYTTDRGERDFARDQIGYVDQGILGYAYPSKVAGTWPIYRLFHIRKNDHFYTKSVSARDYARDHIGYIEEGVLGYFLTEPYSTLNVKKSGSSSGTVIASGISCGSDCSEKYKVGTKVTLLAKPSAGAVFAGWQGACSGSGARCSVTMNGAKTVKAVFNKKPYTIAASAGSGGKISPAGSVSVTPGANQTFTFTPNTGYRAVFTVVDGKLKRCFSDQYTFNKVEGNHSIRVYFSSTRHRITVNAGPGGRITPDGSSYVSHGAEKTFTITPDTGYQIEDVKIDGKSVGPKTSYVFSNVTDSHSIAASFKRLAYTIQSSAASGGSISPAGETNINFGEDLTVTISPQDGYRVAAVLVDGEYKGEMLSYTFEHVSAEHDIKVFFKPGTTHTISARAGEGGSISPSGNVQVDDGSDKHFSIAPNRGYTIADVKIDGVSIGITTDYTFNTISADHTIEVSFEPDTPVYTLTSTAGPGGTISPSGAVEAQKGSDRRFIIAPDAGYQVADVKVDGVSISATSAYEFTNVSADHTIEATFEASESLILSINDAEAKPGGKGIPVVIALDNSMTDAVPVSGMQFKLNYDATAGIQPTGAHNATTRLDGFTVSLVVNEHGTDSNVLVLLSKAGGEIESGNGALLEILFDVSENAQPETFSSLTITDAIGGNDATATAVPIDTTDTGVFMIIEPCDKGDINCDGVIDKDDRQIMSDCILGRGTCERCDINEDGQPNVLDLLFINSKIIDPGTSLTNLPTLRGKPALNGTSAYSFPNAELPQGSAGTFGIGLTNDDAVIGGQLTLHYDSTSGFDITDISLTERTDGFYEPVVFNKDETDPRNATVTVLFFSETGATIEAGAGDILEVSYQTSPDASGMPNLILTDSILVNQDGFSQPVTLENGSLTVDDPESAYTVIVNKTGSGQGSVFSVPAGIDCGDNCTAEYPKGSEIRLVATPEEGSVFVGWFGACGGVEECVFTLESHSVVEAIFDKPKEQFPLNARAETGGVIAPSGEMLVNRGQVQTFTITPDDGYEIKDVKIDGVSQGAISSYTFENVNAEHMIEVSFKHVSMSFFSFFNFDDLENTWRDVNKSADNPDDDWMCWAAAAANILDWAGWGTEAFETAQDIFAHFQDSWTNAGGLMKDGWNWWFDGSSPQNQSGFAMLNDGESEAGSGGNYWADYDFFDYFYEESACYNADSSLWSNGSGLMQSVDEYLHRGFGTTLAIYNGSSGHALSAWGYEYDEYGDYTGIWVTDSDDGTDDLKLLSLLLDEDTDLWYLDSDNLYDYGGWYLGGVQALAQNPGGAVPEPGTVGLFGLGLLVGLILRSRKTRTARK